MTKRVRVNVRTAVNASTIRREQRNGREVIVVPSATLPDDIVMNGVKYSADEIRKSYMTLNRTPAPLGHPETDSGAFLSARDPEAINQYWVGAWNENVRQERSESGSYRVHLDKVIDVEVAKRSEGGQSLLNAIERGEPIHTSTGLWANLQKADDPAFAWTAHDIEFDHDAILLTEKGAATPEQGVGMLVNKNGETIEVEAINSMLDQAEQELEWAAQAALRALETEERIPLIERFKTAMRDAFASLRETTATNKETDMSVTKEQFDQLSATVATLAENMEAVTNSKASVDTSEIAEAIANAIKPLRDEIAEMKSAKANAEKAELDGYVDQIVKANLLDEESAKELTLNAAKSLAAKCKPASAAAISRGFATNADDEFAGYDLNAHLEVN